MNPEQWLSLKWNGGSTMSDRWLNQSKIIQTVLTSFAFFGIVLVVAFFIAKIIYKIPKVKKLIEL